MIRKKNNITYYLIEDLKEIFTEEEIHTFQHWFLGKTGIVVNGKLGFYSWDVDYFKEVILRKIK